MDTIHHIAVQVGNIKETSEWYKTQYDVKVVYEDETWALLQFSNVALALVLPNQHPPHFAIVSENADHYGTLNTHRDGTASVYIQDPAGNHIEMIQLDGKN
ncbi:VOC family protein [Methylotuvimicrobium buryatense]|uniref:VOC family protein n=1 Tax=Methylotuvimicrobium buryatense TaxID=95641 RepID=A0A4P9UM34_METBY|nr:VOC family protein [Methylotuvimicrobium buryatense]QCW82197.1 VOC family protein [Methylotuvimicrobium buryatense]